MNKDHAFLLESAEHTGAFGRYSFIGLDAEKLIIPSNGQDPLQLVKEAIAGEKPPCPQLPFSGGAVGYLSYDYIRFLEDIPKTKPEVLKIPVGMFLIPRTLLVFDHFSHTLTIISEDSPTKIVHQIEAAKPEIPKSKGLVSNLIGNFEKKEFEQAVVRAKEYINDGEIFQVVLSQRFEVETDIHPFFIYRALRRLNPSPYMFYLSFENLKLVGSSPEMLVKLHGNKVYTRPIAGTRPRGKTPQEDLELEKELLSDEKELAEHLMLVDLARNDIGRVCEIGSVKVDEYAVIERYSHVMHIVSQVSGVLRQNCDAFDLMKAAFPAGTVSGAPKVRAMEIIEELEPEQRGPYAGAVVYFSYGGNMDSAITIRTMIFNEQKAYIQAGAGIVYDSVPEREFQETINKMKALFKAFDLAKDFLL